MTSTRTTLTCLSLASAFVLTALLAGCGAAQVVEVHRAALVQPPAPPMWSGRTRPTGLSAGNNTVVWNDAPQAAPQSDSGLYVSSVQFDGKLHFQLGPTGKVSLWVPFSYGLSEYAFAASPCLLPRPTTGVLSGGIGAAFSTQVSQRWYLGTSIETLVDYIPSRIRTVSGTTQLSEEQQMESTLVLRWSGVVGVDFDWIRLFGSVGLRNHPTNTRITHELSTVEHDPEIEFGPLYGLVGVGVEVDLGDHFSLLAQAYQPFPLYEHDLIYGPILGLTLDLHMGRS